jgi:hypothetical protein
MVLGVDRAGSSINPAACTPPILTQLNVWDCGTLMGRVRPVFRFPLCAAVLWTGSALQAAAVENGALIGRVADRTGAAITRANVTLSSGVVVIGTAPASSDGSFRFDGIPPGTYELVISATGFRERLVQSIRVRSGVVSDMGDVRLEVGQIGGCPAPFPHLPTFSFRSCEGCASAIDGVVANRVWNTPAPGVAVSVKIETGEVVARAVTGSDGGFTFVDLRPGVYTLTASKVGHIDFVIHDVTVRRGQRTSIKEHLPMHPCPTGAQCRPMTSVWEEPVVCP